MAQNKFNDDKKQLRNMYRTFLCIASLTTDCGTLAALVYNENLLKLLSLSLQ